MPDLGIESKPTVSLANEQIAHPTAKHLMTRVQSPVGSNQRPRKLAFKAFLLDVQLQEGQCEISVCGQGLREKIFQGERRSKPGPKSYWAPQALLGPMSLNHFLSAGCRSSFKSEGITIFAYS